VTRVALVVVVASIAIGALACAQSDSSSPSSTDSGAPPVDAHVDTGTVADASKDLGPDDVNSDGIFPHDDTNPDDTAPPPDTTPPPTDTTPPTCATPSGSTATASGAYMSAPGDAIDGNLGTVWNSGDYSGSIDIHFPHAIYFDRVRVANNSLPDCAEPYTFSGYLGGTGGSIGSATLSVTGTVAWAPTVSVTPGSYDELRVDVGTSSSWIAIAEIVVYDSAGGCGLP
jgi:hypothetical protein